jgi:hypothetical protein
MKYHCSFHLRIFQGIVSTEERVYTLLGSVSSKDTTLARGKEWRGFLRLRIKGKVELFYLFTSGY